MIRTFRALVLGSLLFLSSLGSVGVWAADALLWPLDARETTLNPAPENANWVKFIVAQGQVEGLSIALPSDYGVGDLFYPSFIQPSIDPNKLPQSAAATGAGSAVLVQLQKEGILWAFAKDSVNESLRTSATSEGLTLGVSWLKLQLSNVAKTNSPTDSANPVGGVSDISLAAPLEPLVVPSTPDAIKPEQTSFDLSQAETIDYVHPGLEIKVEGVDSFSQLMSLTANLREQPDVDYTYVSYLKASDVRLVLGGAKGNDAMFGILSELPSLALIGNQRYRYVPPITDEPANLEALLGDALMSDEDNSPISPAPSIDAPAMGNDSTTDMATE